MRRELAAMGTLVWLGFAAVSLSTASARGVVPNTLAGDVVQSGAAVALLVLALCGRRAPLLIGIALAVPVALSAALGHPWRDVPGAPLLALVVAAPLVARGRVAAIASAIAWIAFSLLAIGSDPEPRVALISHAIPGAIALAPLLAVRLLRPPDTLKSPGRLAPPWPEERAKRATRTLNRRRSA